MGMLLIPTLSHHLPYLDMYIYPHVCMRVFAFGKLYTSTPQHHNTTTVSTLSGAVHLYSNTNCAAHPKPS